MKNILTDWLTDWLTGLDWTGLDWTELTLYFPAVYSGNATAHPYMEFGKFGNIKTPTSCVIIKRFNAAIMRKRNYAHLRHFEVKRPLWYNITIIQVCDLCWVLIGWLLSWPRDLLNNVTEATIGWNTRFSLSIFWPACMHMGLLWWLDPNLIMKNMQTYLV